MFVEHMQSMEVANPKDPYGEDVAWSVRFEKQAVNEERLLREYWLDANKDSIQKDKNRKALEDKAGVDEV